MAGTNYLRQQDLVSAERLAECSITLIGAGAIGSFTALALAKMGVKNLTIYDPDLIEDHNLPNQFYRIGDLGLLKVEALANMIYDHTGEMVEIKAVKYINQKLQGIVILAVDSMDERKRIWRLNRHNLDVPLWIDARMGAEVAVIHAINPMIGQERYEQTLYSSKEALPEPCTRRAIIYTALGISAFICAQVKAFVMNEPMRRETIIDFKLGTILP